MKRILAVFALVVAFVAWNAWQARRPFKGYPASTVVQIEAGTPAARVAGMLVARGILAHPLPFLLMYGLGRTAHRTLKAGEYLFDRPLTPIAVYEKLEQGRVYAQIVVIPEGFDRFDMARIFHDRLGIPPGDFLQVTRQVGLIHDLDPAAPTLEGYLFPDTYRVPYGAGAEQVVEMMVTRFRQILRTRFENELEPGSTKLHEVITLASLVEKETPDPLERPRIAGVFARRLGKSMLLNCDPTVIYAARLARGYADLPQPPVTRGQLEARSPYNTYRVAGLPPGPICSPGVASIRAALDPASGTALYFVSNHHGGHIFAATLEEHARNVARYRRQEAYERQGAQPIRAGSAASGRPSGGSGASAERFNSGDEREQQKRTHSRLPAGARAGTGGASGNSPDTSGARPTPRS